MKMTTLLRLPSELGYEKVAMASAATIAKRLGFSSERIEDIKTAVAEACINAIEHGNQMNASLPVTVELCEDDAALEIWVSDEGRQPVPCPLPRPGDHPTHRRWGLFLIQKLVDEFSLNTLPGGGHAVRMRLYLAGGQAA
jgi:serine/threonine-protein kinase RsbW